MLGLQCQISRSASPVINSPQSDTAKENKLQDILDYPAVQAGLVPFLVALVTAELFRRSRLSGLALIAGFAVTVYLVSNFALEPLTATRKIVLLGLLSAVLALLLNLFRSRWLVALLPVLGGAAAIWTAQRVLQHRSRRVLRTRRVTNAFANPAVRTSECRARPGSRGRLGVPQGTTAWERRPRH